MASSSSPEKASSSEKPYTCSECGLGFNASKNLAAHRQRHHEEKRFECPDCEAKFSTKEYLRLHRRVHTDEKPYSCPHCGKGFRSWGNLRSHEVIHTGEMPYECELCGTTFARPCSLRRHMKVHSRVRPHLCTTCHKEFSLASHLRRHIRCVHEKVKSHSCPECGAEFSLAYNLKVHLRIHSGSRPFTCECGRSFAQGSALAGHRLTHERHPRSICEHCNKVFFNRGSIRTHKCKGQKKNAKNKTEQPPKTGKTRKSLRKRKGTNATGQQENGAEEQSTE